ncbi:receptor-type tyrosine- phosphatase S-like isoform X11 [Paramuricea clavata]|uniref:Receptor-type tyrosine- phosphatase S-like isoform X11 n=2 Tax=Paramuricea clavata TaxID=317549 RepID=A0A7D9IAR8_PARCT|nr:receptor-type tyrosine- phosphatase S-like isoform X11 [Paramuricea clavata]
MFSLKIVVFLYLVQNPAPVNNLWITPYQYAARVTWSIPTPQQSSYITKVIIYLNGAKYETISRETTRIVIKRFKPNIRYKVEIQTEDGYWQKSTKFSKYFVTNIAGKICDKPLLQDTHTFPDDLFSGSGGSNYQNARLTEAGWCASGSRSYLSIDLQKEYHLTQVVVITDKTQRSSTYSLIYGRAGTWINRDSPIQITENQNEYQPFIKPLNGVYNARYIKIQSTATENIDFCLRIELCGEVQKPAPVYDVQVTPSVTSAQVTWRIRTAPAMSSYITKYYIYLDQRHRWITYRRTDKVRINIPGLTAYTKYTVGIVALDGYSQRSSKISNEFTTIEAAPSGAPRSVAFTKRSRSKLTVSWIAPSRNSQNGELTGYNVCYSDKSRSSNPSCSPTNAHSNTAQINNLQPATKYFVTVAARTIADGPKSAEISKITNGERVDPVAASYSSLNLTITKPASYIKEVMIIVKDAPKDRGVEEIEESDLKPYDANTRDPYVTAYLKVDDLPQTFMIGDGKEYNSKIQKYFNQPLKQNSSYILFLRFFESQVSHYSYYSTQWSKVVKTFAKPPAPVNLKIISTAPKKYTISWTQPFLPEQTTVLKYHGNYNASQGTCKTLSISSEMRSVTIDVEFNKQYTFDIQVETRAGRSDVISRSWISHSAPLKLSGKTDDGYIVILIKPKEEQKIKTVALVIFQLQSESSKPPAPENLNVENSPPSDTKANNVVFIAKQFDITEFQNDTVEIFLRESKGNRRRKREAVDVYILIPNTMYRIAQMNTDGAGNPFWSYWSDPFTFTKVIKDDRDGESGGGSVDGDDSGDPGKRDDGGVSVGAAVGASFAVVVIIIAVVLAFIFFRRRRPREQHENEDKNKNKEIKAVSEDEDNLDEDNQEGIYLNKNDDVEENVHPPVPVAEFAHYVNEMKANDNYEFQKEYDDLPSNTNTAWEVAKKPFNKQKNRYGNIVTYDHCRVVLSGDEKDDYINASYMDGIKENAYIATQGPTLLTLNDMWRMVWEQRSYSIVMVTSLVELLKPKCDKYWPDEGTEKYGDIEVTLMKIEEFAYYVIHTLELKKDKEEREVRHYFFQSWPDHGVPKYPTQILAFRRHFRTHHMEQSGPIIVHCRSDSDILYIFASTRLFLSLKQPLVILYSFVSQ